jgi:hypothetical protein
MVHIMHDGNIPVVPIAPGEKDTEFESHSVGATDEMTTVQCDQQTYISSLGDPTAPYESKRIPAVPKVAVWGALRRKVILALVMLVGSIVGVSYFFQSWEPQSNQLMTTGLQGNNATSHNENDKDMDITTAPAALPPPSERPPTAAPSATAGATFGTDPAGSNEQGCRDKGRDGNGQQSMAPGDGGHWWSLRGGVGGGGVSFAEGRVD